MSRREVIRWKDLPSGERIRLVSEHCLEADSYTDVVLKLQNAGIYGQTRSAIAGFFSRHMPRPAAPDHQYARPSKKKSPKREVLKAAPVQPLPPCADDHKTIDDLGFMDCRFPMWPHKELPREGVLYCGTQVDKPGDSFCAAHRKICFTPITKKEST